MITPALGELKDFLNTTAGEKAYLDWMGHPVTQKVLLAARELARPRPPLTDSDCKVAYGESIGAHNIIDFITNPVGRAADKIRGSLPAPRYGAPDIKEK